MKLWYNIMVQQLALRKKKSTPAQPIQSQMWSILQQASRLRNVSESFQFMTENTVTLAETDTYYATLPLNDCADTETGVRIIGLTIAGLNLVKKRMKMK